METFRRNEQGYIIPKGYSEDNKLDSFDIIHICPTKPTGDNGIKDAVFFNIIFFNRDTMTYKISRDHDSIWGWEKPFTIDNIRKIYVYKDGATLIEFDRIKKLPVGNSGQSLYI